jgi:hypothetical protein
MTDLTLGRGEIHFAKFGQNQVPGGERFLGNCPEFNLNVEQETLDHYKSTRGTREKDESLSIEVTRSGSIVTDAISVDNLAMFFFGTADVLTQASATGETETLSGVVLGLSYQLGMSDANPAGIRSVENVVVTDNGAVTTYVAGTDYTLDADRGRITLLSSGSITSGEDLTVTYDIAATNRDVVVSSNQEIEGALRFLSFNAKGKNVDFYMPWVKIRPNGDLSLIQESDWMTAPFNVEVLTKTGREAIYLDGQPYTA